MKSVFCLALVLFGGGNIFGSDAFYEASLYTPPVSPSLSGRTDPAMGEDAAQAPPCVVRIALDALPVDPMHEDLSKIVTDLQALDANPVSSTEAITAKLLELIQRLNTRDETAELLDAYNIAGSVCIKHEDIKQRLKESHTDVFFDFSIKHLRMFVFLPSITLELLPSFIQVGTKKLFHLFVRDHDLMKAGETHDSSKRRQTETQMLHIKKSFELVNIRIPGLSKIIFQNYQPLLQDLLRIDLKDRDKAPQLDVPCFVNKGRYLFEGAIKILMTPTTDIGFLMLKHRVRASAWDYDDLTLRYEELTEGVPHDLKTLVFTIKTLKFPEE